MHSFSGSSIIKKERFKNEDEEDRDDYTVAVVDNPLYAENEADTFMKEELGEYEDEIQVINNITTCEYTLPHIHM